jgi:hypothetical protein
VAEVELVYDADCPNVSGARAALLRAFARAKIAPSWQEWRRDEADAPARVRGHGSPTILVDGKDVSATGKADGASCRLYVQPNGSTAGAPSVEMIAIALRRSAGATASAGGRNWKLSLAMVPGIGAALFPKLACPACWPAYAWFLTSVGLSFLLDPTYLLPLTAIFLSIAVGALAYGARTRRGYQPFAVGVVAAATILAGKFTFETDKVMYAGVALLIGASIWNSRPRRGEARPCAACVAEMQTSNLIRSDP